MNLDLHQRFGPLCGCGINNQNKILMKIKYLFYTIISMLLFSSCDPLFHDDFIIVNNCNEAINVTWKAHSGNSHSFVVLPSNDTIFLYSEWIGGHSNIEYIDNAFEYITVEKNGHISTIDFTNHTMWYQENVESSKHFAYYTHVKYYLIIKPEYFE
jgi:hypothetical protein